jgi:hypothetical protein
MKANELRIGNLLECWYGDNYFEVTIEDLQTIYNGKSKAKPILLTEEWLLKFGFEKDEKNEYWFWKNCVSVSVLGYIELLSFNRQSFKTNIQLKYIHQLQNLYFTLTGKELVVSDAVS